jgi:hypothetical protein
MLVIVIFAACAACTAVVLSKFMCLIKHDGNIKQMEKKYLLRIKQNKLQAIDKNRDSHF